MTSRRDGLTWRRQVDELPDEVEVLARRTTGCRVELIPPIAGVAAEERERVAQELVRVVQRQRDAREVAHFVLTLDRDREFENDVDKVAQVVIPNGAGERTQPGQPVDNVLVACRCRRLGQKLARTVVDHKVLVRRPLTQHFPFTLLLEAHDGRSARANTSRK